MILESLLLCSGCSSTPSGSSSRKVNKIKREKSTLQISDFVGFSAGNEGGVDDDPRRVVMVVGVNLNVVDLLEHVLVAEVDVLVGVVVLDEDG